MDAAGILINQVVEEWQSVPNEYRPLSVWVRQYPVDDDPEKMISGEARFSQRVWLLTQSQLQEKNPLDWRRFYILQTWPRPSGTINPIWNNPPEFGYAAFAPYPAPCEFYVETIWALRWGCGCRVRIESTGKVAVLQDLWRS